MDLAKYRSLFVSETREYLQAISHGILQLIESPSQDLYDQLFRSAHSIKGMAASMGYHALKDVSHQLEDLLEDEERRTIGRRRIDCHFASGH